jgi:hypothetical protein
MKRSALFLVFVLALTGCSSAKTIESDSAKVVAVPVMNILVMARQPYDATSCSQDGYGRTFLREGASVRVYSEFDGALLASGTLSASAIQETSGYNDCFYSLEDLEVPMVDSYRTIIDGTYTIIASGVDLRIAASEKRAEYSTFGADLFLEKEFFTWYDK